MLTVRNPNIKMSYMFPYDNFISGMEKCDFSCGYVEISSGKVK
jgi:hypothetical protein